MTSPIYWSPHGGDAVRDWSVEQLVAAVAAAGRVFNDVADLCRARDVVLAVEFESKGNPLCGTPAETLELIAHTGNFVTACCDTIYLYNRRLDPYASVLPLRGKVGLVHLSDSDRLVPGDGAFDFPPFIQAIREIRYAGPIFVQIDPRMAEDLAHAYQRAVELTAPLGWAITNT